MAFVITTYHHPEVEEGTTQMAAFLRLRNMSEETIGEAPPYLSLIIGDTSGSMAGEKIIALRQAMKAAVDILPVTAEFALLTFSGEARRLFPPGPSQRDQEAPEAVLATPENKQDACVAVDQIQHGGGTVMSSAIALVHQVARARPGAIIHCLFLTDGKNESSTEHLVQEVEQAKGHFQCDVRLVGDGAYVDYMRTHIATPLLGQVKVIREAADMAEEFRTTIEASQGKAVGRVCLALRCPKTANIVTVSEMVPQKLDLAKELAPDGDGRTWHFRTAAWTPGESREYLVHLDVVPFPGKEADFAKMTEVGREVRLAVPSVIWNEAGREHTVEGAPIKIIWTDDAEKSSRVDMHVAHAKGQMEMVQAKQQGVEALRQQHYEEAEHYLQRVMDHATHSGNAVEIEETIRVLRRIGVEVEEKDGVRTIRVQRQVAKIDLDDFDARSTITKRFGRR